MNQDDQTEVAAESYPTSGHLPTEIRAWGSEDPTVEDQPRTFWRGLEESVTVQTPAVRRAAGFVARSIPAGLVGFAICLSLGIHHEIQSDNHGTVAVQPPPPAPAPPARPQVPLNAPDTEPEYGPNEFRAALQANNIPDPDDDLKEAKEICQQLRDGMTYKNVHIWFHNQHPDWTYLQVGGFVGDSTGMYCAEIDPYEANKPQGAK